MHVDINGFKKIARDLRNEKYLRLVSVFLTELTQIIRGYEGSIDRFVGDQVTALFGFGIEEELACKRCIECALTIQTLIKYSINPYLDSISLPKFTCSIGVDCGDIWLARIGIKHNNEFTLVGHPVLIAAQLLDLAPPATIFLGELLYDILPSSWQALCQVQDQRLSGWNVTNRLTGQSTPYRYFRLNARWKGFPL